MAILRELIDALKALDMDGQIPYRKDVWLIPEDYGTDTYLVNLLFKIEQLSREALYITAYAINADTVELLHVCGYPVYRIGDDRLAIQTSKGRIAVKSRLQIYLNTYYHDELKQ